MVGFFIFFKVENLYPLNECIEISNVFLMLKYIAPNDLSEEEKKLEIFLILMIYLFCSSRYFKCLTN